MNSHNNRFYSLLCGKLLGDGSITKQKGRKPRFKFTHKKADYPWCHYSYSELKEFIPLNEPKYRKIYDNRTSLGYTESYYVQSKTSNIITNLESIWYRNRVKVLPFEFISNYLNEEALAWWYQDDGHLKLKDDKPSKIILSTDNFTKQENIELISLLQENFALQFKLDRQDRLLLYDQVQILYFLRLINKYIHPSMERKTYTYTYVEKDSYPKVTSIYLPEEIVLSKPTFEINKQLVFARDLLEKIEDDNYYRQLFMTEISKYRSKKQSKKCYRIAIRSCYRQDLEVIKGLTGLQYSEIVLLTFRL